MFFAFIGFDVVSTAAEETKRPQRDMPIGILGSLAICTVLYVAVSLVVTGMVKYTQISVDAPLAEAFRAVGRPEFATIISIGALVPILAVVASFYLMLNLPSLTWLRFGIWMVIGFIVYFTYSASRSRLAEGASDTGVTRPPTT